VSSRLEVRSANVLYDRDDRGGTYLQLYSRPYGDGFFFEIIERRGGYDGYGARNAAYRTAALKRLSVAATPLHPTIHTKLPNTPMIASEHKRPSVYLTSSD
jgi:hypothetical protein